MGKNIGVYKIQNNINGKIYVGSSIHLSKRINDHLTMLRANKHENNYLQNAYNKYGKKNFTVEILEYGINKEDVRTKEQKWIDELDLCNPDNGYNINGSAVGGCSPGAVAHNYGNRGSKNPLSVSVAQIDRKTKEVIKVWGGLREVKRNIDINITHISNICTYFSKANILRVSKGYCWCFEEDIDKVKDAKIFTFKDRKPVLDHSKKANYGANNGMARKVVQLTRNGKFIKKYNSIKEAADFNSINAQTIYNQLFRKPKNPRGDYKWMYYEDYQALTKQ